MTDVLRASYDAAPYESKPIATTNVDNLATVARFHGVDPAPPRRCRVLELGCASGGNLIPMAFRFPESVFIGIDISPVQIDEGRALIAAFGLANVQLEARSILDVDADFGEFDYIICHGVYSWVPSEVQDATLRVCAERLAPNGVVYVSYNTYPGWHARMMLRQMLMSNDDPSLPHGDRVARARRYVQDIGSRVVAVNSAYAVTLRQEIEVLETQPDSQVLHEQLEAFNEPLLVSEFVARAEAHGLEYVADARIPRSRWPDPDAPPASRDEVVRREQDADFSGGQAFRRSILVRRGARATPRPAAELAAGLWVVMRAVPAAPNDDPAERAPGARVYEAPDGVRMATSSPVLILALELLGRADPQAVPVAALVDAVRARFAEIDALDPGAEAELARLPATLLHAARAGMVDFQSLPSAFTARLSERPVASRLARRQAEEGAFIADQRHASVLLPPLALFLLPTLDGTRDRRQLVAEIERGLDDGKLTTATRPDAAQLADVVEEALRCLASSALIVS